MKNFFKYVLNDLKFLYEYRIVLLVSILTFVFAMAMAIFPDLDQSNFIYFNIFILPVIIFSISMFIGREEETLLPVISGTLKPILVVFAKIFAAVIVELIPIVAFTIVMRFTGFETNYFLLFLTYLLGVIIHIIIALSLTIISKKSSTLTLNYLVYILVFSASAILYSNGLIPLNSQYVMLISPAFLSGVIIDNILASSSYSPTWLLVASVTLQFVYGFILVWFVIRPYFKSYLIASMNPR
ncbi:MAG: hypothetical protein CVV56_00655 [Tenericutes bacterium HGW-Tenericutes-1]|jgi:hypothetical protein|nr:MAG: hypothetical protein CVV56_00655 [Tenericutes bacterium HGW-Tenericutes-1]